MCVCVRARPRYKSGRASNAACLPRVTPVTVALHGPQWLTAPAEREALQRHEGIVELYARFVDDCHLSDVSVTVSHYQLRVLG